MRYLPIAGVLALLLAPSLATAQAPGQESAFSTDLADYGGFVGLDTRFGEVMGDFGAFAGGHAALLLKQRVYMGLAGAGLVTDDVGIDMGYGGLLLGYVVPVPGLVQVTVDGLLAGGGVRVARPLDARTDDDWDPILVFEPTVGAEVKLAPVARLGFGVGYRFVGGSNTEGVRDSELRGVNGTATLRLGWF